MDTRERREWLFFGVLGVAAAALALLRPEKAIDFRVYWENARHYFGGGHPMYGSTSGTGWAGGVYRYPPLYLDLFRPLALLPLRWGAAIWAVGKVAAGGAIVIALRRRWGLSSVARFWPALLLLAPYFIQDLRYGNAQFYITALTLAGFLALGRRREAGGGWIGFAGALKVWPVFFLPCMAAWSWRRWGRAVAAAMVAGAGLTLLPALWRGWARQWGLLWTWFGQERAIAATNARYGELWYPGQSLHDVMARYLGVVDYKRLVDSDYREVAWLHLAQPRIEMLWWGAVVVLLGGLFWWLHRAGRFAALDDGAIGLMFCAVLVIEPHVHRLLYATLLWPALWLAAEWSRGRLPGRARWAYALAVVVAVAEPLVPGGGRQRVMQVYGVDFWLVLLPLTLAVVEAMRAQIPAGLRLRDNPDVLASPAEAE